MKYVYFAILVLSLTACASKTDKERFIGSWEGDKIYRNGVLMCSWVPREQEQIAKREYNKNKEVLEKMQLPEYEYRQNLIRSMIQKLTMQFTFTETDTVFIKTDDTPYKGDAWRFRVVEDSNVVVLEEDIRKVSYLYKVTAKKLILKNADMRIEFLKKD